jgi:hypothetical protein
VVLKARVYRVLDVPNKVVSDAVRATRVAVVPSKVYNPKRASVVPLDAVLAEETEMLLIVASQRGVKKLRYKVPLATDAFQFPLRGWTSTIDRDSFLEPADGVRTSTHSIPVAAEALATI